MPIYNYRAKTIDGDTIKGSIEVNGKQEVIAYLKDKGCFPLDITQQGLLQKEITFSFLERVKVSDIAIFCRQFYTIINAGIPVLGCLDIIRQQTENQKLKEIIDKVYEVLQKGNTLSAAMKAHKVFPAILMNMVEAGEVSGTLETSFERMAVHFEKENRLNKKIKGAMTYPIIVAVIAMIVITILITFVVPTFVSMFAGMGMELPTSTKILLATGDFIQKRWYILLGAIIGGLVGFKKYADSEVGKLTLDGLKLRLPIVGKLNKKIIASRFSRTLSTLLASGLPLLTAIDVVAKVVDNHVVAKGLNKAGEEVSRGVSLASPIANMQVFPPMVVHMLRIGEDTGSLENILEKTADFYDTEVETAITQMTTLLEPLIMLVMALVVGFVVISIVQPMFGVYGGIE